jgi:hypothetical protein
MGVNLPADMPLRTIHYTDYLPLLKSDVIILIQNIWLIRRQTLFCLPWNGYHGHAGRFTLFQFPLGLRLKFFGKIERFSHDYTIGNATPLERRISEKQSNIGGRHFRTLSP